MSRAPDSEQCGTVTNPQLWWWWGFRGSLWDRLECFFLHANHLNFRFVLGAFGSTSFGIGGLLGLLWPLYWDRLLSCLFHRLWILRISIRYYFQLL